MWKQWVFTAAYNKILLGLLFYYLFKIGERERGDISSDRQIDRKGTADLDSL